MEQLGIVVRGRLVSTIFCGMSHSIVKSSHPRQLPRSRHATRFREGPDEPDKGKKLVRVPRWHLSSMGRMGWAGTTGTKDGFGEYYFSVNSFRVIFPQKLQALTPSYVAKSPCRFAFGFLGPVALGLSD